MWPFRNPNKPHARWINPCRGTGRMPVDGGLEFPPGTPVCPVCGHWRAIRKHRNTIHNWPAGSLRLHSRPQDDGKRAWWKFWKGERQ